MKIAILVLLVSSSAFAAVPRRGVWRPSVASVTEMLKMSPEKRQAVLIEQPDSVYDSLLEVAALENQPMNLRWRAVTSAALLRREKSAPDMMKIVRGKEWFMRNAALVGMAEFAPSKAAEAARELLKDPALVVRSAAVEVLAKNGSANDRDLLWKELSADYNRRGGRSLWIRSQIVKVLAEKPIEGEMNRFSALLAENEEHVQLEAVRGLERLSGLKLGEGAAREKVVRLWKNYFSQPASELR